MRKILFLHDNRQDARLSMLSYAVGLLAFGKEEERHINAIYSASASPWRSCPERRLPPSTKSPSWKVSPMDFLIAVSTPSGSSYRFGAEAADETVAAAVVARTARGGGSGAHAKSASQSSSLHTFL